MSAGYFAKTAEQDLRELLWKLRDGAELEYHTRETLLKTMRDVMEVLDEQGLMAKRVRACR